MIPTDATHLSCLFALAFGPGILALSVNVLPKPLDKLLMSFGLGVMFANTWSELHHKEVMIGYLISVLLSRLQFWKQKAPSIGCIIHSFCNGAMLSDSFLSSKALGTSTFVVLLIHEIPHRIADTCFLQKSIWIQVFSGIATIMGGCLFNIDLVHHLTVGTSFHFCSLFLQNLGFFEFFVFLLGVINVVQ